MLNVSFRGVIVAPAVYMSPLVNRCLRGLRLELVRPLLTDTRPDFAACRRSHRTHSGARWIHNTSEYHVRHFTVETFITYDITLSPAFATISGSMKTRGDG